MTESRVQRAQRELSAMLTRPNADGDRRLKRAYRAADYNAAVAELLSARTECES